MSADLEPPGPGPGRPTVGTGPLVVPFTGGDASMVDLLGGKGAHLAEMTRLGLPVPEGFTVTTEVCRAYLRDGRVPGGLDDLLRGAVQDLERATGRRLGDPRAPLLVSVRSGAPFSMPGMMDTVLDVGMTPDVVDALAAEVDERFAWDCYRRLVQMYGRIVLGVDGALLEAPLARAVRARGVRDESGLAAGDLRQAVGAMRAVLVDQAGTDLPAAPWDQLRSCVDAVLASWNSPRARVYRRHEGIPDDLGTAVNVVRMVYGNTGARSGSGVCFTRDPATGEPVPYGDYLLAAQGEDVVSGARRTVPLRRLGEVEPAAHDELLRHLQTLEKHYRDLCDVEFTVEDGRLWLLQTRIGKRSPAAAFVIAADLAAEGLIDLDEALARVDGHQLERLLHPAFGQRGLPAPLATGLPASPGASVGRVVFGAGDAVDARLRGEDTVLVRPETSPEDVDGMLAAVAVVTTRGGLASHAAVIARGIGRTCVTGVDGLDVDPAAGEARTAGGVVIRAGDVLSVDGSSGAVYAGALEVHPSAVLTGLTDGGGDAGRGRLARAVRSLLAHADTRARMTVRANAETAEQALLARALGARGIGLCRTEHTLLGDRRLLVERVVTGAGAGSALREIERLAVEDLEALLRAMDGLPVVVRLLDPPLHEFLPDHEDLAVEVARLEGAGRPVPGALRARLAATARWRQTNPMLGLRGVRLLTVHPELIDVHVRALVRATRRLVGEGLHPRPEVMVPLVSDAGELEAARDRVREVARRAVLGPGARAVPLPVGVMIELPRAALTAGRLAACADFFSFGTNDLTQTTWGMSRDDGQASFLTAYRETGLVSADPFERLDEVGVGELVRVAVDRGRAARADLELGACGEHAGDPASVRAFDRLGLDYVSCSPLRVPVARLEAGRAVVLRGGRRGSDTR